MRVGLFSSNESTPTRDSIQYNTRDGASVSHLEVSNIAGIQPKEDRRDSASGFPMLQLEDMTTARNSLPGAPSEDFARSKRSAAPSPEPRKTNRRTSRTDLVIDVAKTSEWTVVDGNEDVEPLAFLDYYTRKSYGEAIIRSEKMLPEFAITREQSETPCCASISHAPHSYGTNAHVSVEDNVIPNVSYSESVYEELAPLPIGDDDEALIAFREQMDRDDQLSAFRLHPRPRYNAGTAADSRFRRSRQYKRLAKRVVYLETELYRWDLDGVYEIDEVGACRICGLVFLGSITNTSKHYVKHWSDYSKAKQASYRHPRLTKRGRLPRNAALEALEERCRMAENELLEREELCMMCGIPQECGRAAALHYEEHRKEFAIANIDRVDNAHISQDVTQHREDSCDTLTAADIEKMQEEVGGWFEIPRSAVADRYESLLARRKSSAVSLAILPGASLEASTLVQILTPKSYSPPRPRHAGKNDSRSSPTFKDLSHAQKRLLLGAGVSASVFDDSKAMMMEHSPVKANTKRRRSQITFRESDAGFCTTFSASPTSYSSKSPIKRVKANAATRRRLASSSEMSMDTFADNEMSPVVKGKPNRSVRRRKTLKK